MSIDYSKLGQRIVSRRKALGMSQAKLAEKADLSNNYISNIENSYSIPSLQTFTTLCQALEITPNELLLGIDDASENYLEQDIAQRLAELTPQNRKLVCAFIELLINEANVK